MSRAHRERRGQPPAIPPEHRRRGRRVTPLLTLDESTLGPAMRALPPGMRAFVHAKVHLGSTNIEAGKLAGYSSRSLNGLTVHTSRVLHDPRVQDALAEESKKLLKTEGPKSIRTLVAIRDDAEADHKDRIKCAVEIMNRAGLHAVSEHHEHQHVHMSEAEKDRRILALAAELGLSPDQAQKMLIAPAEMQRNSAGIYELAPEPAPEPSPQRQRDNELRRVRRSLTPEQLAEHKAEQLRLRSERLRAEYAEHQAADAAEAPSPIIIDGEEY